VCVCVCVCVCLTSVMYFYISACKQTQKAEVTQMS